ncbi:MULTISPECIES: class I SAM-dependent methyltransferase [unclassified Cyanobium]|uniref:class I SAM-dependent methyltransferase n=1 Tax=unclassified Cyanobium TaxID=2627006 RepID=UPI0020CE4B8C|nr:MULTISPECIES: class I SAM-dependent methyltransferase [unclassified Cyanobium]MCP9777375.1 class I SAM-dependent methyltransferase [Cyanobium sp. Tous-M-B4]MCP9876330.1 class I SAM-dependent methyltransferase [Cyanobium sp. A2C-AMD]
MQRIPEPELMDKAGQVLAYAQADFATSDAAMVERLAQLCGDDPGTALVDLGCGPGNISLLLAARWPAAKVLGIDGAPRMLAVARERLAGASPDLAARLRFKQALLPLAIAGELEAHFSAVVCNSLLHHLHDPAVLWQTVTQLGSPGAFVYVQDLRRPDNAEAVEALVVSEMEGAPEVLRRDYRASLHAAFTPEEVQQQLEQAGLAAQLQVAPRQERYLEVWGRLN